MRRESHDPTAVHSSIALLQERFKRLQRMKEMREERQLLKLLPESKQSNQEANYRMFNIPSELINISSSRSPPQVSLSLSPTLMQSHKAEEEYRGPETQVLWMNSKTLYPTYETESVKASSGMKMEDCESTDSDSGVDTSLHL